MVSFQMVLLPLSLKLSEIRMIEKATGDKPVLLLDDVLSELDGHRQAWLLESIRDIQTMISCTGLEDLVVWKKRGHARRHAPLVYRCRFDTRASVVSRTSCYALCA